MDIHCMKHGLDAYYVDACDDYVYQGYGLLINHGACVNCIFHIVVDHELYTKTHG